MGCPAACLAALTRDSWATRSSVIVASGGSGTETPPMSKLAANAVTLRMGLARPGELLVERQRVDSEGVNGLARLIQARCSDPLRGGEDFVGPGDVCLVGQDRASRLNLDAERAEGVSEYIVNLACDARALVEEFRAPLLGLQLLALGKQRRGLLCLDPVRAAVAPDQQAGEHQSGEPEQRAVGAAECQPADLGRQDACSGHREACRQAGVAAGHHRRDEREDHE